MTCDVEDILIPIDKIVSRRGTVVRLRNALKIKLLRTLNSFLFDLGARALKVVHDWSLFKSPMSHLTVALAIDSRRLEHAICAFQTAQPL